MMVKRFMAVFVAVSANLMLVLPAAGAEAEKSKSCTDQAREQGIVEAKDPEKAEGFMIKCTREQRAAKEERKQTSN